MLQVCRNDYVNQAPQHPHSHDETTITLVLSGAIRERVGRVEESAGPLSYVIKPRDTVHADQFSAHVRTLQITIPDDEVPAFEEADHVLKRWRWHHGGPAVPLFLGLLHKLRSPRTHVGPPPAMECDAIELLGALRADTSERSGEPPLWLARIREIIDDSAHGPSVRSLATDAGVHPVYLARQFREWYGCSITQHARRLRARRAARAILQGSSSLSHASYGAGFADHPHMCRVFRRETGLTPTAFRTLVES